MIPFLYIKWKWNELTLHISPYLIIIAITTFSSIFRFGTSIVGLPLAIDVAATSRGLKSARRNMLNSAQRQLLASTKERTSHDQPVKMTGRFDNK
jgi:hypothetical protein